MTICHAQYQLFNPSKSENLIAKKNMLYDTTWMGYNDKFFFIFISVSGNFKNEQFPLMIIVYT